VLDTNGRLHKQQTVLDRINVGPVLGTGFPPERYST
jgi:hypothetical protein